MLSNHTIKESNALDDRLAGLVGMAQNYKADGYSDVQALEAALGDYERSSGRNIGYATLERLYQALEARGFSFPEEELEEATTRGGTKVKESAELTPGQLERIAVSSGYNPMTFLDAKRIGYRNGNPLYLLLSYDNNEDEYIVGKAEISRGKDATSRIDFDGNPDFFSASRAEAYDAFHTLADGGKLTESKYAAGGRALQDDYNDIIEDVIAGWDVSGMTSGNMLPLDQIKAALQNYDSGLTLEDIHDIIDTYFDYSPASAAVSEPTIGELEAEAQELAMEGWPEEDVNQRLAQKHGMDKDTIKKIRAYESSEKITWSSFDTPESNALEEKYLPANGDGDNMASQAVTATTKLIYKWFNDGDVYDNSYGLSGWANDISGSANWLAKHVPGARDILWRIQKTHSEEEYVSNILWPLFNLVYDPKLLSSLEKKPKVDDAYSCKGPFEFNYEDEDAYQEEDPESFGDYDQDYELDESTGKKAKLARKQEHRYYASSNDRLTVLYIDGKPVTKEYDVIVPEGTKYANTRGSWRMPLSGSSLEEEASKLLRRYNSGFSIAVKEFQFRSGYGYILKVLSNKDLPEPATARELYDHEGMSELWGTPEEYFAHEGREDLVELARSEAAHQEDFEESKKTSIGNLLREAAMPVQEDKLGAWYKSAFTNDRKATENKEGFYQVRESRVAKKPRVKESVPNWSEFQSDMFNAINGVYEKYNMGNAAEKADKMDMIKVLDWMDEHGYWDEEGE